MSGLVLLYYLRFWLSYHWSETEVLGTGYVGYVFFDFVVTWIEFALWFAWLAVDSLLSNRRRHAVDKPKPVESAGARRKLGRDTRGVSRSSFHASRSG